MKKVDTAKGKRPRIGDCMRAMRANVRALAEIEIMAGLPPGRLLAGFIQGMVAELDKEAVLSLKLMGVFRK